MLNQFRPHPESFGTGIDGGSNFKSIILIEQYSIEDITFSSSIFSDNSDDGDVFILIGFVEPVDGFLIDDNFWMLE